ncbi:MAG TPA: nucleotide sugar dehydrogenase [Candidatus Kapabacteria bacterium]|nr:nucleotide sugar dehydrogenase [Candidatus Kapabacteria bacterium]
MNIVYIGGGFVGACSAAVTADSGHDTLVFDIDADKVKKLSSTDPKIIESCLYEEGLAELLIRNHNRIRFTSDLEDVRAAIDDVDAVFMCVPTPEKNEQTGETDLTYYKKAVEMVGPMLSKRQNEKRIVIINKSTVPIDMIDYTRTLFEQQGVTNFGIVSNPEFLVEGKAIEGSIHPSRVIVGAEHADDFVIMRRLYSRFHESTGVAYIEVNPYEAAAGKLLANFLLFNKVVLSYDVVGRTCEYFPHLAYENVRKILTSDPRIGSWGLYDSLYAGGSCFIKDALSLAHQLEEKGTHATLVRTILDANTFQREHFIERAETEAGYVWNAQTVAVLGVAFKQDTNDIRNSGAIAVIQQLLGSGVSEIRVYDPVAMGECKKYFDPKKNELYRRITYVTDEKEALTDTTACIICTDWPQFKTLAETISQVVTPPYLILDGRRMIHGAYTMLQQKGFDLLAVGSPFMKGQTT